MESILIHNNFTKLSTVRRLSEAGTFGGNECIVAFARLHNVMVVIHQLNTALWTVCTPVALWSKKFWCHAVQLFLKNSIVHIPCYLPFFSIFLVLITFILVQICTDFIQILSWFLVIICSLDCLVNKYLLSCEATYIVLEWTNCPSNYTFFPCRYMGVRTVNLTPTFMKCIFLITMGTTTTVSAEWATVATVLRTSELRSADRRSL
jgi:hypothetical protein